MSVGPAVLTVESLSVVITRTGDHIVEEVDLTVRPGEVLGLVGESGCGKTTVSMAMLGHTRVGARIDHGRIAVGGRDLTTMSARELQGVRGRTVAYIPQDPPTALNPALRIHRQLEEVLEVHAPDLSAEERRARVVATLAEVALSGDDEFLQRYPHQLSGGQQQRVVLAMAFVARPQVLVCDEPTTGLDVTTQARVLETVRELCRSHQVAAIYVSHDLAVVSGIADRVAVMYAGQVVEIGPREDLFHRPRHPYTRRLMRAIPRFEGEQAPQGIPGHAPRPGERVLGCAFAPRCPLATSACTEQVPPLQTIGPDHAVRCIHHDRAMALSATGVDRVTGAVPGDELLRVGALTASHGRVQVLHGIDLDVRAGECLALVGESGSGKTTTVRCIAGLHQQYDGLVTLGGEELAHTPRRRTVEQRRRLQYVFQNPYASLNPRYSIRDAIAVPLKLFHGLGGAAAAARTTELLDQVALPGTAARRYPDELSGGERQRVAIARALAADPSVLLCDEITSALDVSVQATIMELLARLREEMGLSLVFVTHNLALIRSIADRVAVMQHGRIVEAGPVAEVLDSPRDEYTRRLLAHTPQLDAAP
ncbi:ABC transporter ATP-binding protein [Nocardioides marmoribigeumensis]|uniref:Peptide/nickel transport system ATP-binding protein n=1 Tax=Nocardioides marmoribigeumensis TaxID=433649 RepID=A0ABU2BW72_9ACTN|nr:ABC transporter ATP-binding protein [Nocardioides marmoribigeumensis]MDR7362526.1 peptide/nickel transport system ATP-binding protein [Nocardioides marmoribigeumensis]